MWRPFLKGSNSVWLAKYLSWLILVVILPKSGSTNTQAAGLWGIFLIGSFEVGRCTLSLGHSSWWQPTQKYMEERSICSLSVCPHSCWQVYLSCYRGILSLMLETTSLRSQHRQEQTLSVPLGSFGTPAPDQTAETSSLIAGLPDHNL